MRVLMTGASSFTGAWIARRLAEAGMAVTAPRRSGAAQDDALTFERLASLPRTVTVVEEAPLGSDRFLATFQEHGPFDVLCLHGATVGDHRAPGFDVLAALRRDTCRLDLVLDRFAATGGSSVVVTGSFFEADEGRGEAPHGAIGGYGLAKTLTWHAIRHAVEARGLKLGKFVIPHPYGPMEKPGLTSMLARSWLRGETPVITQPALVRDHIHVDLLARAYLALVQRLDAAPARACLHAGPSGRVESVAAFVERFAAALGSRLGVPTPWRSEPAPMDPAVPRLRYNPDPVASQHPGFDEAASCDELAAWYLARFIHSRARSVRAAIRELEEA